MNNMYFLTKDMADKYIEQNGVQLRNKVYRLDDKIIKIIDDEKSQSILYNRFSRDELLQFKDIEIDSFSFARALVYTGLFNKYAVINEYVNGYSLDRKHLCDYPIDVVITAVDKIFYDISKITDKYICVNDIHFGNMIFDGNKITMIDTTEYCYVYGHDDLYEYNIRMIMDMLFQNIFFNESISFMRLVCNVRNVHRYFSLKNSEYANFRELEYLLSPVETLTEMKKFIEEDFEIKLNTFAECHKYIDAFVKENTISNKGLVLKK